MIMAGVTLLLITATHANNLYNIFQKETVNVKHVYGRERYPKTKRLNSCNNQQIINLPLYL